MRKRYLLTALLLIAFLVTVIPAQAKLPKAPKAGWNVEEGMPDLGKLNFEETPTGLLYAELRGGEMMMQPPQGSKVTVHYSGYLLDGRKFDSSYDRGRPIEFTLGIGQVIAGWDEALARMEKGAKWVIAIPPELGYGRRGQPRANPPIKPNAWLVFVVELVDFK